MKIRRARALVLTVCLCRLAVGAGAAEVRDRDEEPYRSPAKASARLLCDVVAYPKRSDAKRAADVVKRISEVAASEIARPGTMRTDVVVQLYKDVPFERVRDLAKRGITVDGRHVQLTQDQSIALAKVRDYMINEVYKEMCLDFGLDFVRLDFGNKASGVKSDVDHTAFTDFLSKQFEGLDIRAEFEKRFRKRWGISQASCDICVHSGLNRVPDWRGAESVAEFDARMLVVLKGLAETPDAYAQEGAYRLQVELGSLSGAEEALRRLKALEVEASRADLSPAERARYEALRREAEEGNPCTEFKHDPKTKSVEVSKSASALRALFMGVRGDVLRMYAADVCLGNYLFHTHYADKGECPKYVLRSFEEGLSLLRSRRPDETLRPLRYEGVSDAQADALIRDLYPDSAGFDQTRRDQVRRVMDVALRLRQNHKRTPDERIPPERVWAEMMKHLQERSARKDIPADELMRMAKLEYDRASTEVLVWNNLLSSRARAQAWLQPNSLPAEEVKVLADGEGVTRGALIEKLQLSSFYALKLMFASLPAQQVEAIIDQAPESQRNDLRVLRDVVRAEVAQFGRINIQAETGKSLSQRLADAVEGLNRTWARTYDDFWIAARNDHYSDEAITGRVLDRLYDCLGYDRRIIYDGLDAMTPRTASEWRPTKALSNLLTAGNALSVVQVLQTYQQTPPDQRRDAVMAAIFWEGLCNLPGVVHLVAARDALHGHWGGVEFLMSMKVLEYVQTQALEHGVEWAIPVGPNLLIYLIIGKGVVQYVGYEMFEPLKEDAADLLYVGRTGPTTPPPELTVADAQLLEHLEERVADNRENIAKPDTVIGSEEYNKLIEETRDLLSRIRDLKTKQEAWQDYQTRSERWRAGLLRAGFERPVTAQSFEPLLGEAVPLRFFVGRLDDEPATPIDLTVKPLTPEDVEQLDTLKRKHEGLCQGEGGLKPLERVDHICDLREAIEALVRRQEDGERAKRALKRIRADCELLTRARRQNLVHLLRPRVLALLAAEGEPPPDLLPKLSAERVAQYEEAREHAAGKAIEQYVRQWFDGHVALRGVGLQQEAAARVIARMKADYAQSVRLEEQVEAFDTARDMALRAARENRRTFLRHHAASRGMEAFLDRYRRDAANLGLLALAATAPVMKPEIRVQGVVTGEGDDEQLKFSVKVIASHFHYPPPYTVKAEMKAGEQTADGAREGRLLVEVRCKDTGTIVGTVEHPFTLTGTRKERPWTYQDVDISEGGVRVRGQCGQQGRWFAFEAEVKGLNPGWHKMAVRIGDRSFVAWGLVGEGRNTAVFRRHIQYPLPPGRSKVTLAVPGVRPVTFEAVTDPLEGKPPDIEAARQWQKTLRERLENAADADREDALLDFCEACTRLAEVLRLSGLHRDAIAALQEGLAELPEMGPDPDMHAPLVSWRIDALRKKADLAFYVGDRDAMAQAWKSAIAILERALEHGQARRQTSRLVVDLLRDLFLHQALYGRAWVALDGDPSVSRTLWRKTFILQRQSETASLERYYRQTRPGQAVPKPRKPENVYQTQPPYFFGPGSELERWAKENQDLCN